MLLPPAVILIHDAPVDAVQSHSGVVVTLTDRTPPLGPIFADRRFKMNTQLVPCCTVNVRPAMVSVPLRTLPRLICTEKLTDPLPEPLAPAVMSTQDALLTAVHAHPAAVVTDTGPPDPPDGSKDALVVAMRYVQGGGGAGAGGGGGGGAGGGGAGVEEADACRTANVWFSMLMVPLRTPPLLAATLNATVPVPLPEAGAVTVIHPSLLFADQLQPPGVVTLMRPVVPSAPTSSDDGEIVKRHVAAACVTRSRSSLTITSASRAAACGLAAT